MKSPSRPAVVLVLSLALSLLRATAQQLPPAWSLADAGLAAYFEAEVRRVESACLSDVRTLDDWKAQQGERRRQLFDMLGLWPLPARTDLKPVVAGRLEGEGFVVERLHFQSMPGLYVTANLYLPAGATGPVPAILYVCGHAEVKQDGVSLGNKTAYRHHGIWFARHGYACLVVDTLQLGEVQGVHHGTYRLGQWWWNARGYTPAGVEAWNAIRALDYLETRPEVDRTRFGMTGRSGGGSYTWTTAALDERIRCAAPVAGIADLRSQVCDGAVEGHCDCMFFVNTHRWDFALNAALVAPRPLLVVNTDADTLFPLEGVERLFARARRVYTLYGAQDELGLVIGPGPHEDTQDLQVPVLRWFNRHLMHRDPLVRDAAEKALEPRQLRVLDAVPADQRNTAVQESFNARPLPEIASLAALRDAFRARSFAGWPASPPPPAARTTAIASGGGLRLTAVDFVAQEHVPLRLYVVGPADGPVRAVRLSLLDDAGWHRWVGAVRARFPGALQDVPPDLGENGLAGPLEPPPGTAFAWFAPRGLGPSAWKGDARKQVQVRRRFQLLGQTVDGMRVWDVRRALAVLRESFPGPAALTVSANGVMASHALHAAVFEEQPLALELHGLPTSYRDGADYLNAATVAEPARVLALVRSGGVVSVTPSP